MHLDVQHIQLENDHEAEEPVQQGSSEAPASSAPVRRDAERRMWRMPRDEMASQEVLTTLGTTVSRRHLPTLIEASPWRRITRPRHVPPASAGGGSIRAASSAHGHSHMDSNTSMINAAVSSDPRGMLRRRPRSSDELGVARAPERDIAPVPGVSTQSGFQSEEEVLHEGQAASSSVMGQQSTDSCSEGGHRELPSEASFQMGTWHPGSSSTGDGVLRRRLLKRGPEWGRPC
jgi:hypothetical protein